MIGTASFLLSLKLRNTRPQLLYFVGLPCDDSGWTGVNRRGVIVWPYVDERVDAPHELPTFLATKQIDSAKPHVANRLLPHQRPQRTKADRYSVRIGRAFAVGNCGQDFGHCLLAHCLPSSLAAAPAASLIASEMFLPDPYTNNGTRSFSSSGSECHQSRPAMSRRYC